MTISLILGNNEQVYTGKYENFQNKHNSLQQGLHTSNNNTMNTVTYLLRNVKSIKQY